MGVSKMERLLVSKKFEPNSMEILQPFVTRKCFWDQSNTAPTISAISVPTLSTLNTFPLWELTDFIQGCFYPDRKLSCFFVWFFCCCCFSFETGSLYVAPAVLELITKISLALNSQKFAASAPKADVKGVCRHCLAQNNDDKDASVTIILRNGCSCTPKCEWHLKHW